MHPSHTCSSRPETADPRNYLSCNSARKRELQRGSSTLSRRSWRSASSHAATLERLLTWLLLIIASHLCSKTQTCLMDLVLVQDISRMHAWFAQVHVGNTKCVRYCLAVPETRYAPIWCLQFKTWQMSYSIHCYSAWGNNLLHWYLTCGFSSHHATAGCTWLLKSLPVFRISMVCWISWAFYLLLSLVLTACCLQMQYCGGQYAIIARW